MSQYHHPFGLRNAVTTRIYTVLFLAMATLYSCSKHLSVESIDPKVGPTAVDQQVRIHGENFKRDGAYRVYFGGKRARNLTILSDTELMVTAPRLTDAKSVDVVVRADDGTVFRIKNGYKYVEMAGNVLEKIGE